MSESIELGLGAAWTPSMSRVLINEGASHDDIMLAGVSYVADHLFRRGGPVSYTSAPSQGRFIVNRKIPRQYDEHLVRGMS